jgi:hypothetical protein
MNYSHERFRRPQRVLDPRQIASLNVKNANDDRIVGRTDEGGLDLGRSVKTRNSPVW